VKKDAPQGQRHCTGASKESLLGNRQRGNVQKQWGTLLFWSGGELKGAVGRGRGTEPDSTIARKTLKKQQVINRSTRRISRVIKKITPEKRGSSISQLVEERRDSSQNEKVILKEEVRKNDNGNSEETKGITEAVTAQLGGQVKIKTTGGVKKILGHQRKRWTRGAKRGLVRNSRQSKGPQTTWPQKKITGRKKKIKTKRNDWQGSHSN